MDTEKPVEAGRPSARSLLRSTGIVGVMTVLSRILGLVRDMVFTRMFGATPAMDAFLIANRIPNMLRRFFAEGAFSQAFVPVLSQYRSGNPHDEVRELVAAVTGTFGALLFVVTAIGVLAAPAIIVVFAPGFLADEGTFDLATLMLRFTFPYLFFVSLTALAGAILNSYGRFAVPAFTPVLLNVCLIGFAIWIAPRMAEPTLALAFGVFVAGLVQLLFQLPFLSRLRLLPRPRFRRAHAGVRRIGALMLPAIFGSSVAQINILIDNQIASFLGEGKISWLYYSDRLVEFPLGVFGIALATVILPSLSRSFSGENGREFSATLDWALRLVLLIALPATIGLFLLAGPLVVTIYFGGAFDAFDVAMARASLWAFSVGLPAFIGVKVLAPAYFARQDTRTPVKVGVVALVANVAMNFAFVYVFIRLGFEATHAALAMATALAAFLNAGLLFVMLRRRGIVRSEPGWMAFSVRTVLGCAAMTAFLVWQMPDHAWWLDASVIARVERLAILVAGGIGAYGVTLLAAGLRPTHLRLAGAIGAAEDKSL